MIRPILFNGPMVRAILEGRKTQTRRMMKPQPQPIPTGPPLPDVVYTSGWFEGRSVPAYVFEHCPFGVPGDRLWVRETWLHYGNTHQGYDSWCNVEYRADGLNIGVRWTSEGSIPRNPLWGTNYVELPWRPSIHMPRWASRIMLEITGVRVERLQEITEEDAKAEGIDVLGSPIIAFGALWDALHAKRGYGWGVNPWVWVIEFRRDIP